ncbi:hypothetical protein PVK06_041577 [Gossypium arboreum]|uniref:Disease resistance RPH8A-like protein n=1 Tax=Gossypium arboreum TaxID=29729 RepID=A0ABR0NAT1_GOSAR|nr:hypothetical protein PVK06_041577 [Gossypium arboreum]
MPSLQWLEIWNCLNLKMLPEGLRFITTLKELKIESMPKAFKDILEEGGEDFYKVKHVPSIIFQDCEVGCLLFSSSYNKTVARYGIGRMGGVWISKV